MAEQIVAKEQLISYDIVSGGSLAGPTVIFLHGWRSNGQIFKPLAESLAQRIGARCFLLDLPGFGASPNPKQPFSVSDYRDVVIDFAHKLKLPAYVLIGHSFGGRVAIKLGAENLEAEKLVLVDTAGIPLAARKKKVLLALAKLVKPFFKAKFLSGLRTKIYDLLGASDYVSTPDLLETFRQVTSEDLQPYLKKISVPTLILWGENDQDTPISDAQVYNHQIKGSKLVVLEGAGHFSFVDRPTETVQAISNFLV